MLTDDGKNGDRVAATVAVAMTMTMTITVTSVATVAGAALTFLHF